LRGAELSLEIDERALDLDMDDLLAPSEKEVGRSQVARS